LAAGSTRAGACREHHGPHRIASSLLPVLLRFSHGCAGAGYAGRHTTVTLPGTAPQKDSCRAPALSYRRRMRRTVPSISTAPLLAASLAAMAAFGQVGCPVPKRPGPQTAVVYRAIDNTKAAHYALSEDEGATIPTPIRADPPLYPATMIGRGIAHVD